MKIQFFIIYVIVLASSYNAANAKSANQNTFQDKIPQYLIDGDDKFFTLTVENDLFGAGTDKNYTNGVRLTYYDSDSNASTVLGVLDKIVPFYDINETSNVYYSIGQNLYTPKNTKTTSPDINDRPYAAFLYGAIGAQTITDNHIDEIELTAGVVGPMAQGEEVQESVHDVIGSNDPKGWDTQLRNELGLVLSVQRLWPEYYTADLGAVYMRLAPHAGLSLGNVYTHLNTGATLQFVPQKYKWQSPPLRVRPAIPGSGYFAIPDNQFAWSAFVGVDSRLIARNIFLDGNTFRDSRSVDKKHFVTDVNGGFTLSYGNIQTSYTLNWRSQEFKGQDESSVFGAVSVGYRF